MNERDVFLAAREILDTTARSVFLNKVCAGDDALRLRVELLLCKDVGVCSILDETVAARSERPPAEGFAFLGPAGRPDSLGRLGHYEVLEVLGKGGFGMVFRAFDETLQRIVAVKVLAPELAVTSPARQRFLREARVMASVRHENVVQVHAIGEVPLPHLVMEFIPGETLQQRIDRIGPLAAAEVVRLGSQIARGLAAAHAIGLIHRDIKPANVLLECGPHEQVKLADFGLARAADDASISHSGLIAGTPLYTSPEQARGEHIDSRSDLFSLGSVLYVMLSGRPPFRAVNALAVLRRVSDDRARPIREIIPEAPDWLCAVIDRLHAKNPDDRFQSVQEVADLLERQQGMESQPTALPKPNMVPRSRETATNSPSAALVPPPRPMPNKRRLRIGWVAATMCVLLFASLGLTEATGVTKLSGTVIRLYTPEGTLIVESDDPGVRITIDGEEISIAGAGVKELRVKPGQYHVEASKDGEVIRQELVSVARNGKRVVQVNREVPAVPKGNYALEFDGTTSHVEIPSLSRDTDGPLTIEAWVTVLGTPGAVLVRMEGRCPSQLYGWPGPQSAIEWIPNAADHLGNRMVAANTPPLAPGQRAHLAVQIDAASLQLFINGRKVNSTPRSAELGVGQRRGTFIGGQTSGERITHRFLGKIDEVRISKALRYDGEFQPTMQFTPDGDTMALYHCDEGAGDRLTDSSGNGHHGKVFGAKWVKAD